MTRSKQYRLFLTAMAFAIAAHCAQAQPDTLAHDGMKGVWDGQLLAITSFEGELDVQFNARFTPREKCTLKGIVLGFSVVKFDPVSTNDTLVVTVYESGAVPPLLAAVERTYRFSIGDQGFPLGNIMFTEPLTSGTRDAATFLFPTPIVFAPKRDFVIGVKLHSTQKYALGLGTWNGLTLVIKRAATEYQRYNRYSIRWPMIHSTNEPAVGANNASLFLRAIVENDATLTDRKLTEVPAADAERALAALTNYPNPFASATTLELSVATPGRAVLTVHDALGREVARLLDGALSAGFHRVAFDAHALGLPAGMYVARLSDGTRSTTRALLFTQ
jgi:hypothetical protein